MAGTAAILRTALYGPGWPSWAIFINAIAAGCTSGGYTGVAYAEYAALGGARRTEATGLGTAIMFLVAWPCHRMFGASVAAFQSAYHGSYLVTGAVCALAAGLLLALPQR